MSSIIPSAAVRQTTRDIGSNAVVLPAARVTGTTYRVFAGQLSTDGAQERFIVNNNAAGTISLTFFDDVQDPTVTTEGVLDLAPGGAWNGSVLNEVRVRFSANAMTMLAGERR